MKFIFLLALICLTSSARDFGPDAEPASSTQTEVVCGKSLALYASESMRNFIFHILNRIYPDRLEAKYSREDLFQDLMVQLLEDPKFENRNSVGLARENGDLSQFIRKRLRWLVLRKLRDLRSGLAKEVSHSEYEFWLEGYEGELVQGHDHLLPEILDVGIELQMWNRMLAATKNAVESLAPYYHVEEIDFWRHLGGEFTAYDMARAVLRESREWIAEGYGDISDRSEPKQIAYRAARSLLRQLTHLAQPVIWKERLYDMLRADDFDQIAMIDMIPPEEWEPRLVLYADGKQWPPAEVGFFRDAFLLRRPTHVLMDRYGLKKSSSLESKKLKNFQFVLRRVALELFPLEYVARRFDKNLGITRGSWQSDFDAGYTKLKAFHAQNGHADVPSAARYGEFNLGKWLQSRKRHQRAGTLDPEQAYLLNQLGMKW